MVAISGRVRPNENVLVVYDHGAAQLAYALARRAARAGGRVYYFQRDVRLEAVLAAELTERDVLRSAGFTDVMTQTADVIYYLRYATDLKAMGQVPRPRLEQWTRVQQAINPYRINHTRWVLLYWPTPEEAAADGMTYPEYVDLFLRACDQPWVEIDRAQSILVDLLDRARTLEIYANETDPDPSRRTGLRMDIGPMQFANSTIDHNFPGSEVFASPVRDSVQGQLFAAGLYEYDGREMHDIRLRVVDGKIVEATAAKGQTELNQILDTDSGARYFGEVALGTNPALRRRLLNGLLNEKVGGSFHITPGNAYSRAEYRGRPVRLDNGNRSSVHWDIAVPMLPRFGGGRIVVDGQTVQQDGRFLIPGLEVLNTGL